MDIQAPSLDGPITRSKAKQLQAKLSSFIAHFNLLNMAIKGEEELGLHVTLLTLETTTPAPDSATNSTESSNVSTLAEQGTSV